MHQQPTDPPSPCARCAAPPPTSACTRARSSSSRPAAACSTTPPRRARWSSRSRSCTTSACASVLVHGGGPQLDRAAGALGVPNPHGQGAAHHRPEVDRRHLDGAQRAHQHPHPRDLPRTRHRGRRAIAASMPASCAPTSEAPCRSRTGSSESIDYGFVGDIDSVNVTVIEKLLDIGLMPVVSPLSADANGTLAQHQCRHGGGRDRRRAVRGEAGAVHRRAGHSGATPPT